MKTTVDLDEQLLRAARQRAAAQGKSLGEIIEDALRRTIPAPSAPDARFELSWRTERGRLRPGVRLDDRQGLFDLMERRERSL
ncbi:MAG: type II toxin-antitoxin system VapB family antitoxin [Acidobacteriota bacterium]|nr:type II toxin-antitoxin system VapB family antitoxin [Acidobacteriota bacterium]